MHACLVMVARFKSEITLLKGDIVLDKDVILTLICCNCVSRATLEGDFAFQRRVGLQKECQLPMPVLKPFLITASDTKDLICFPFPEQRSTTNIIRK